MRYSTVFHSLAFMGAANMALASEEAHHEHKRAVKYVTNYHTTTVWAGKPNPSDPPAPSSSPNPEPVLSPLPDDFWGTPVAQPEGGSSSSSSSTSSEPPSTPTPAPAPAPVEPSTPSSEPSSSAPSSSAPASSSTDDATKASPVPTSGDIKGVTYSPYNADGTCKSAEQVASDFERLHDMPVIRLYGVDCNQVENVMKAKSSSQKLFLGIFFVDQIEDGVNTMKTAVTQHGSWDDVYTVSVGNELVNSGSATVSQVAGYVERARSALSKAGYNGPVVSVDTFIAVINNPGLCDISDYMAVNAHAYFDFNTAAERSGEWLLQQIQRVWTTCGGKKDVLITESGWPHQGRTYGKAIASKEKQQAAIESIKSTCGKSTILFTAFDDHWKQDGPLDVEKYWGFM